MEIILFLFIVFNMYLTVMDFLKFLFKNQRYWWIRIESIERSAEQFIIVKDTLSIG